MFCILLCIVDNQMCKRTDNTTIYILVLILINKNTILKKAITCKKHLMMAR
jgi:hypothetical protein